MAAATKRAIDVLTDNFDLNQRRKYELIVNEKHIMDLYFRPVTRADRLEVHGQAGTEEAMKMSTYMLIRKAENEDGSKAFALGDLAALRRLPEQILNELELFQFGLDESGNPIAPLEVAEAKKD